MTPEDCTQQNENLSAINDREQKIRFGEYARLKRIEVAARTVLHGLNQRIEAAPDDAKPVFHGIADLYSALLPAD